MEGLHRVAAHQRRRPRRTRQISDSSIRFELSVFASVMGFAMKKRYAPVSQRYESRLKVMRRDEFTHEEYTELYSYSRNYWVKGKKNVSDHAIEPRPDDPVFTTIDGTPASSLYKHLIDDLLKKAELRDGPGGTVRSTYSFRHIYATMRLSEGVDV